MVAQLRDVSVFMDGTTEGDQVCRIAASVAGVHKAHLIGVYGVSRDLGSPQDGFARGEDAIRDVVERQRAADEQKILSAGRRFADLTRAQAVSSEFRVAWRESVRDDAVLRGLNCDLVVSAHPKPQDLPPSWTAEHLLLATATPVLIVPSDWPGEAVGEVVVIAWNRSREARRAVNDAMPLLTAARQVVVLVIDEDRNKDRFGEDPGANLVEHLARHNVQAEILHTQSGGRPIAEAIIEQANRLSADLLVIGAYSRPRAAEVLFGGTTRTLVNEAKIPTLISR